jgi:hypothetical protein
MKVTIRIPKPTAMAMPKTLSTENGFLKTSLDEMSFGITDSPSFHVFGFLV